MSTHNYLFQFEVKIDGHAVGICENCCAILKVEPDDPDDYHISSVLLDDVVLPKEHYLYKPVMLHLLSPDTRPKLDMAWTWRPRTSEREAA